MSKLMNWSGRLWLCAGAVFLFSACSSQESKCDLIKKEKLVLTDKPEAQFLRLKECGMEEADIALISLFISANIVKHDRNGTDFTYGEIIEEFERLKAIPDYKRKRDEALAQRAERRNRIVAEPTVADFSLLCSKPKEANRYDDFKVISHYYNYQEALDCAVKQGKVLAVYFTGHSVVTARKMEHQLFADKEIKKILEDKVILVALYCDDKKTGPQNLKLEETKYGDVTQPLLVFLDAKEKLLGKTGYKDRDDFLDDLKKILR